MKASLPHPMNLPRVLPVFSGDSTGLFGTPTGLPGVLYIYSLRKTFYLFNFIDL
jgi:hypothetical protein